MRPLVAWLHRRSRPIRPIRSRPPYVESLEDRLLPTAYVVTTANDILGDTTPGEVTLRDANTALDGTPSGNATVVGTATNSITFAMSDSAEILLGSDPTTAGVPLPPVTRQVFLDGLSEGPLGDQGQPPVTLDGTAAGANANGLVLGTGSDGSTVRGLEIVNFTGDGLDINGTSGNLIAGDWISTENFFPVPFANAGDGIVLQGQATANTIGGTAAGAGNVLSGNVVGLIIRDSGTSANLVLGNLVGTDPSGTTQVFNGEDGILIDDACCNTIGGTTTGSANVISGNFGDGENQPGLSIVGTGASGNLVLGNLIGPDITGMQPLFNEGAGVSIGGGASANTIGGTAAAAANVIASSFGPELQLTGAGTSGNVVIGNLIGTNSSGTGSLLSEGDGVLIDEGAFANTVGGTCSGSANLISGNNSFGVELNSGASANVVLGNLIGTDITGTVDLGNDIGVFLAGQATANTVGGTAPGAGNVISGNNRHGIAFYEDGTSGNLIQGNLIGTDIHGTAALANGGAGIITLSASSPNTIGGTTPGAGNIISGNRSDGVDILGNSSGYVIQGNLIGTDLQGTGTVANGGDGVHIESLANTVGGTAPGAGNVISGNGRDGLAFSGGSNNLVLGNLIGTDLSGAVALPNDGDGIHLYFNAVGNTVGGAAPGTGNVISGNGRNGVNFEDQTGGVHTSVNLVVGNWIGTDKSGRVPLGNAADGVLLLGFAVTDNTVGGTAAGAGNIISANGGAGLEIVVGTGNLVAGNLIGTDGSGSAPLGNAGDGVYIHIAAENTIGGTTSGARNIIAANGGSGVDLTDSGAAANLVAGNAIGTDATGTLDLGNTAAGVLVANGATANTIGGTAAGAANVIAANANGVVLSDAGTSRNWVGGNRIGTDASGTAAHGNHGDGVLIAFGAAANTLGGTALGAANVISGNSFSGVDLTGGSSGNVVLGNRVGTDLSGTTALGNSFDGVRIDSAVANTVGGTAPGAGNVISGNRSDGVGLRQASDNAVLGNLIGTDGNGTVAVPNFGSGVRLDSGASANTVGGPVPAAANVISGNSAGGVELVSCSANLVVGNLIGPDRNGTTALGNGSDGVAFDRGAVRNTVGAGNVISGNSTGVFVLGQGTRGNVLLGNLIGTDATGTARLGNAGDGVLIFAGAVATVIGGTAPGAGNVISANGGEGIEISGTSGNTVLGNLIGTDRTGTAPLGNSFLGLWLNSGATRNTVAGNVISANGTHGVEINQSSGNLLLGNMIGTDRTGRVALGNTHEGLLLFNGAARNTVGGTAPGAGNVLSGNDEVGLFLYSTGTSGNVAIGNLIGTDKTGTRPLGNQFGVAIGGGAANNIIGGTAAGAGNVISANGYGVDLFDTGTSGNVLLGNRIGTDRGGTLNLGNTLDGVILEGGATRDVIGGTTPSSGNIIAFNAKGVVLVDDGATGEPIQGDSILGNRIFANSGPGIDINDDGPTANGPNPRNLPNRGQNAPIITRLTRTTVSGTLTSIPRTTFRLEFFASPTNGSAYQGQIDLGWLNVTTGASGTVSFVAPVSAIPAGCIVTATATNLGTGDTSEFSPAGPQLLVLSSPTIVLSTQAQVVTLSAQLFSGNTPLVGARVTFRIAGLPGTVTGTVGVNGVVTVTFKVPPGARAGSYVITASYGGLSSDDVLAIAEPFRRIGNIGGRQS
jgi:hypothetical protein